MKNLFNEKNFSISKGIIGTKCDIDDDGQIDNVLSIFDFKKLKKNREDYEFIKNKIDKIEKKHQSLDQETKDLLDKKYLNFLILDCDYKGKII